MHDRCHPRDASSRAPIHPAFGWLMLASGLALGFGLEPLTARADILIRNVTLYDGTGAPAVPNAFVLVKGERIASVSTKPLPPPRGKGNVIDGSGKFLIPGLMDSHVHLLLGQGGPNLHGADGKPVRDADGKPVFDRKGAMEVLGGDLYLGVTSVYDSGNDPDFIFPLRADERAGRIVSPRIFAAGGLVTVPGGFGSARPTSLQVQNWDQARKALDHRFADEKPDMVKLIVERRGIYGSRLVPTFSPEMLKRIVDYAHENGYRTTVHISTEMDALEALDAGVDAQAHPVLIATMNDAFIKRLAERRIPVSTTLVSFANIARVADDPGFLDDPLFKATVNQAELDKQKTVERERYAKSGMSRQFAVMMPYAKANIKALYQAGVILALGTDRSLGPNVHQELELLNESGISPFDLIRVATLNGAIYIGREKDLGSVEPGKYADLVLLKSDPAADVKNFRKIDTVIKDGRKVDLAALDIPVNHLTAVAQAPSEFLDCPTCPQMVVVPAGTFLMGSDAVSQMKGGENRSEGPVRRVTIGRPFAAGKFEVTNAQFAAFVDASGYRPAKLCSVGQTETAPIDFRGPLFGKVPEPTAPVTCVSWHDAVAYTAWLSGRTGKPYRLLTEAEWEYAARAGTTSKWPWGDDDLEACQHENVYDLDGEANPPGGKKLPWPPVACHDGHATLAPVGSYPPNPFGLHDMLGNAWEWVEDCMVQPYPATPVDGSAVEVAGPCEKRVVRGASWYTRLDRHRPSFRGGDTEATSTHQFGFRVARDLN